MNAFDQAAANLLAAKAAEKQATEARIAAEQAVICQLPQRDEGSVTASGLSYKVAVTYGMNRTVDAAALDAVRSKIPEALFEKAVTYKPALVLAGLRYLQNNEPDTYAVLAQAITAKPSKPAVRVEPIEQAAKAA